MSVKGDVLLLAIRAAHYALAEEPRAHSDEFKFLNQQANFLAEAIEELVDRKVDEALKDLQDGGYIPV